MKVVYRKELKYVIHSYEFAKIRPKLRGLMKMDANGTDFGYTVRSLYFDSLYDRDYYDTVDGLLRKGKIRIRVYVTNGEISKTIKLELKEKDGTDSLKSSLSLSKEEAIKMMNLDYDFLLDREEKEAQKIYLKLVQGVYFPKTIVEYDREAYIFDVGDVRVTFDSNTRATAWSNNLFDVNLLLFPAIQPETGVLEVKYTGVLPCFIKEIVRVDRLQSSNGKYIQARSLY